MSDPAGYTWGAGVPFPRKRFATVPKSTCPTCSITQTDDWARTFNVFTSRLTAPTAVPLLRTAWHAQESIAGGRTVSTRYNDGFSAARPGYISIINHRALERNKSVQHFRCGKQRERERNHIPHYKGEAISSSSSRREREMKNAGIT